LFLIKYCSRNSCGIVWKKNETRIVCDSILQIADIHKDVIYYFKAKFYDWGFFVEPKVVKIRNVFLVYLLFMKEHKKGYY
jgi:hypothetical protein